MLKMIVKENKTETTIKNYDAQEMLQYIIDSGKIDLSSMQKEIDMKKREYYLSKHIYQVYQNKNGQWCTYLPDDTKKRIVKRRNTEKEIQDLIVEFYKSKEEEPTFKEVFFEWVDEKLELREIGKGTYDRYLNDYKRFFFETDIESTKFNQITEDDLEIFIRKTIVDKELTQKAYSNFRTLILGTFKHGKKRKYTILSISSFIKDLELSRNVFKKNTKNKEDQIYLEDEIPLVTDYLKEHGIMINLGLLFDFQSGIRTGELAAIKFSDIKGKTIHIQRQEIKYKDTVTGKCVHMIKEYPKSDAGNRYVILSASALKTIERARRLNPNGEYIFEVNGKRILTNSYNDALARVCKELKIKRKSMHKIRRTYGTTLIDANCDDSLVMEQLGHADIATTRKFYYYSNKNQKSKEIQIEKAINI